MYYGQQGVKSKVKVIYFHFLNIDQGEDELVVHVFQEMRLQLAEELLNHILHNFVRKMGQPIKEDLVSRRKVEIHFLFCWRLGGRLPGTEVKNCVIVINVIIPDELSKVINIINWLNFIFQASTEFQQQR